MLVNAGLEPPCQNSFVNPDKTVLKFFAGSLDGGRVFEAVIKELPRLLTGFSVMGGMVAPASEKQHLSTTFPLLSMKDLDFSGLKHILAQVMSFSRPWGIHLLLGMDVVVTIRSSMKAHIGGCRTPNLVMGPLHSTSDDMFMTRANRMAEMVHPATMPFLGQWQSEVPDPAVTLSLKLP